MAVPPLRVTAANRAPVRPEREFVLYWMIAARRRRANYGLQRAVELARELGKPLVILEALRVGYPWASDRLHGFVLDGMAENARSFARAPVTYYPYVEPRPGAGSGLLAALGELACAVVTDEFPAFFLPRMVAAAARRLDVRLEPVDSNGVLPLRAARRTFLTAHAFRRHLHAELPDHLSAPPRPDPLARVRLPRLPRLPAPILQRWAPSPPAALGDAARLAALPIDHDVIRTDQSGGPRAAARLLDRFLRRSFGRYAAQQRHPDAGVTSGLSPYLHFGHIGAHQILERVLARERWTPARLRRSLRGRRAGWGLSENGAAFVDQLVTWRELGFNMAARRDDFDGFDSLPEWARDTLHAHARDPRPWRYDAEALAAAATHDAIWNAAQRELTREGRVHNYLRMLWGKKLLEWSNSAERALDVMIELNNRFALDGRDPNSYSGIFWVLGRYDRPWGPERPIFGKVRYMSSDATRRKLKLERYLRRYG